MGEADVDLARTSGPGANYDYLHVGNRRARPMMNTEVRVIGFLCGLDRFLDGSIQPRGVAGDFEE